jgi:transposase-like protein
MGKSGANKAAIDAINAGRAAPILVCQVKYLNNIVEQDHRAIKRVTRPMLNFKSFRSARSVLAGIELIHMMRNGHFATTVSSPCRSPTNFLRWLEWSVWDKQHSVLMWEFHRLINNATPQAGMRA